MLVRTLGEAQQRFWQTLWTTWRAVAATCLVCGACLLLGACSVYDPAKIGIRQNHHPSGKDAGSDGSTMMHDDGGNDGGPCVPTKEICNGKDDDCNGTVDDQVAADDDCTSKILHAPTSCESGSCVRFGCNPGYFNCDGEPSNGCEPLCSFCHMCDDAGDDAGSDGG